MDEIPKTRTSKLSLKRRRCKLQACPKKPLTPLAEEKEPAKKGGTDARTRKRTPTPIQMSHTSESEEDEFLAATQALEYKANARANPIPLRRRSARLSTQKEAPPLVSSKNFNVKDSSTSTRKGLNMEEDPSPCVHGASGIINKKEKKEKSPTTIREADEKDHINGKKLGNKLKRSKPNSTIPSVSNLSAKAAKPEEVQEIHLVPEPHATTVALASTLNSKTDDPTSLTAAAAPKNLHAKDNTMEPEGKKERGEHIIDNQAPTIITVQDRQQVETAKNDNKGTEKKGQVQAKVPEPDLLTLSGSPPLSLKERLALRTGTKADALMQQVPSAATPPAAKLASQQEGSGATKNLQKSQACCVVCSKDISSLGILAQQVHINECLDKPNQESTTMAEVKPVQDSKAIPSSVDQHFSVGSGVFTPTSVAKRYQQLEAAAAARAAAAEAPPAAQPPPPPQQQQRRRRRKPSAPRTADQEAVQLAVALSKSLAPPSPAAAAAGQRRRPKQGASLPARAAEADRKARKEWDEDDFIIELSKIDEQILQLQLQKDELMRDLARLRSEKEERTEVPEGNAKLHQSLPRVIMNLPTEHVLGEVFSQTQASSLRSQCVLSGFDRPSCKSPGEQTEDGNRGSEKESPNNRGPLGIPFEPKGSGFKQPNPVVMRKGPKDSRWNIASGKRGDITDSKFITSSFKRFLMASETKNGNTPNDKPPLFSKEHAENACSEQEPTLGDLDPWRSMTCSLSSPKQSDYCNTEHACAKPSDSTHLPPPPPAGTVLRAMPADHISSNRPASTLFPEGTGPLTQVLQLFGEDDTQFLRTQTQKNTTVMGSTECSPNDAANKPPLVSCDILQKQAPPHKTSQNLEGHQIKALCSSMAHVTSPLTEPEQADYFVQDPDMREWRAKAPKDISVHFPEWKENINFVLNQNDPTEINGALTNLEKYIQDIQKSECTTSKVKSCTYFMEILRFCSQRKATEPASCMVLSTAEENQVYTLLDESSAQPSPAKTPVLTQTAVMDQNIENISAGCKTLEGDFSCSDVEAKIPRLEDPCSPFLLSKPTSSTRSSKDCLVSVPPNNTVTTSRLSGLGLSPICAAEARNTFIPQDFKHSKLSFANSQPHNSESSGSKTPLRAQNGALLMNNKEQSTPSLQEARNRDSPSSSSLSFDGGKKKISSSDNVGACQASPPTQNASEPYSHSRMHKKGPKSDDEVASPVQRLDYPSKRLDWNTDEEWDTSPVSLRKMRKRKGRSSIIFQDWENSTIEGQGNKVKSPSTIERRFVEACSALIDCSPNPKIKNILNQTFEEANDGQNCDENIITATQSDQILHKIKEVIDIAEPNGQPMLKKRPDKKGHPHQRSPSKTSCSKNKATQKKDLTCSTVILPQPLLENEEEEEVVGAPDKDHSFSDVPDYQSYPLADLRRLVSQYGLKASSKAFMARKLREIWVYLNKGDAALSQFTQQDQGRSALTKGKGKKNPSQRSKKGVTAVGSPGRMEDEPSLDQQVVEFIQSDPALYTQVLTFEALDLGALHAALKQRRREGQQREGRGGAVSKDRLRAILDRAGTAYTLGGGEAAAEKRRRRDGSGARGGRR